MLSNKTLQRQTLIESQKLNKLSEQNRKVGVSIKWQMSKWKTTDRIETYHSNLESSRTIVFWCYWLTTNNITTLICWQTRARVWQYTIHFDALSLSSIVLFTTTLSYSSPDDYDQHDSCIGVKRLLTIYNKMLTKASVHVRESGFWNPWNFCLWNLESSGLCNAEYSSTNPESH